MEIMSLENNQCKNCLMNKFCTNRLNANPTIIKRCGKLDYKKRIEFVNKNKLIPNLEENFAALFLENHNYNGILISIEILKENFENPNQIFPDSNSIYIKDQLYIEILMKYCKLLEDLGGLISCRDNNPFKFVQNYNKYRVKDVISFYKDMSLEYDKIRELFFYPEIESQNSEKRKQLLKISYEHTKNKIEKIKDDYFLYKNVYNSYKHGYKVRFGNNEVTFPEGLKGNKEEKFEKTLIYYSPKGDPFSINMLGYPKFNDINFTNIYENCFAVIRLIQIFLYNFKQNTKISQNEDIKLFFESYMQDILESLPNDIKFELQGRSQYDFDKQEKIYNSEHPQDAPDKA